MKKKVFLTRRLHDFALQDLETRYTLKIHTGKTPIPEKVLQSNITDVHGLICFPYDIITKQTIDMAKNLKVISTYSVGYDHIDTKHAKKKKIRIGYTPEVLTDATADLAFGLLLDLTRKISQGDKIIKSGKWRAIYGPYENLGSDLCGKTLGIVGLGRIGTAFAIRAKAFGMNLTYHNRNPVPKLEKKLNLKYVSFSKLIKNSDVISIHVPYTKQTRYLFDGTVFESMKNTAYLINTSRGKVINEIDLVSALKNKMIAGAGLDVFETEPLSTSPLFKLENTVLTPHIASSTVETRQAMAKLTIKNLDLGMAGKRPFFSVGY